MLLRGLLVSDGRFNIVNHQSQSSMAVKFVNRIANIHSFKSGRAWKISDTVKTATSPNNLNKTSLSLAGMLFLHRLLAGFLVLKRNVHPA